MDGDLAGAPHPEREVLSYDPFKRPEPQRYLELVPEQVRRRVTCVLEREDSGPSTDRPVDLLFVDTTHEQADTIREGRGVAAGAP